MTQKEIWNLPFIKKCQKIQKQNPYGSKLHRQADLDMKAKCSQIMGKEFAENYFGEQIHEEKYEKCEDDDHDLAKVVMPKL